MTNQGRYQPVQQVSLDTEIIPAARDRHLRSRITALAFLIGALALCFRLVALRNELGSDLRNPALLRTAMQAAAGTPVPTNVAAGGWSGRAPSGLQARALSEIAQAAGQTATAEVWLVHGLSDPSSNYLSQFELCLLYWNEGRRAQAREMCRGSGSSALYWLNQGYLADQRSDPEEALANFQMAAATDPDMIPAWHQLARTLFAVKRYDEAIPAYERMMVLDQTPPADVYDALGRAYIELDNPTMARDVLARGLLLYPDQRVYYLSMAQTFRMESDLEAADSWYERMLQRWPNDAQAWAARAQTADTAGRFDDAIAYYQKAADNQPQGAGYWMNLASVAATAGNVPLASEAFEKAMALQPENISIWLHAGRFYAETDQPDEARNVFEHVLVLQPENSEAAAQLTELAITPQP